VFAALGLVVRTLASVLRDKRTDPGVVVVDEEAHHAVSLLSGHRGGANELARLVAGILGAEPVITTASDAQGFPALDLLGQEFGWRLEDETGLTAAMAALLNGDSLLVCQEAGEANWWKGDLPAHVQVTHCLEGLNLANFAAVVTVTDRVLPDSVSGGPPLVVYRPRTLVVGIGCERGVTMDEIDEAVRACLSQHGLSLASLCMVASIDLKRDEPGMLSFADRYHLPVRWFSAEDLRRAGGPSPSPVVKRQVGTPGVAEPAALLASGNGPLVVPKMKQGRVTVAVARVAVALPRPGRIFLVGLGPGDRADLTPRAMAALTQADVVLGYRRYLEQVQDLLVGKGVIPGELTKERDRAEQTVRLALEGKTVTLVSSGDIGIYGMAGLVFEELALHNWTSDAGILVEVVPGITALSACAALLGAPLMHDFAAISLSDLLTPWPVIVQRLEAAAQADFVIALYNPKSARRREHLTAACRILLQHRSGETPVGLVARAGRAGCRTLVTTLQALPGCEVDMETTILVGNSSTRLLGGRMVTSRGYPAGPPSALSL
jgi:cobalt-precorrin 5A hydrolase/precorrin-3B C17-methyltransferase